jgi:hypothetical protein
MLLTLVNLLFSAGGGGVLGGLLSLFTQAKKLEETKENNRHLEYMQNLEMTAREKGLEWSALTTSIESSKDDSPDGVWIWVKSLRYGMRCFLTIALIMLSCVMASQLKANEFYTVCQGFAVLTGTAVCWWFGARMAQQTTQPSPAPTPASSNANKTA